MKITYPSQHVNAFYQLAILVGSCYQRAGQRVDDVIGQPMYSSQSSTLDSTYWEINLVTL